MTTTTAACSVLAEECARIDALVARVDTPALEHRLAMNAADRDAWYAALPATRVWLDYEKERIEAELARRTSGE